MSWQRTCEDLWGEDWQRGLAETLCVNPRTVQRWATEDEAVPPGVLKWLKETKEVIPHSLRRPYGKMMRAAASCDNAGLAITALHLVEHDVVNRPPWG